MRASTARSAISTGTKTETLLFEPGEGVPRDCSVLFTDDGKYSLICRQKNREKPFLYLGNGKGEVIREIELRSSSPDPTRDRMGGLRIYKDQHGEYFFSYSLNKTAFVCVQDLQTHESRYLAYVPSCDHIDLPRYAAYTLWARLRTRPGRKGGMAFTVNGAELATSTADIPNWRWVRLSSWTTLRGRALSRSLFHWIPDVTSYGFGSGRRAGTRRRD